MEKKYIFVNGIMKLNPNYQASGGQTAKPSAPDALAFVSSPDDIQAANEAHLAYKGTEMPISESVTSSLGVLQDTGFLESFGSPQPLDGGEILDRLGEVFAKYEVPLGLLNKLLPLLEFELLFIIDDSGSMQSASDISLQLASSHINERRRTLGKTRFDSDIFMSRWEEAENRLHTFLDILCYIPTQTITIEFLNRTSQIKLDRQGLTPEAFAQKAHAMIAQSFDTRPTGGTPMRRVLSAACARANTAIYLMTDGIPEEGPEKIVAIMKQRIDPASTPLTLLSCTSVDKDVEWLKEAEEVLECCAELDDYESEKREVYRDQGRGIAYTFGLYVVQQLAAALKANKDDLDALDESLPLTRKTLNDTYGRVYTPEEYRYYFNLYPKRQQYEHLYAQLLSETLVTRQIVQRPNQAQGTMTQAFAQLQMSPPSYNANGNPPPPSYQQSIPMATLVQPGYSNNTFYQPKPANNAASSSSKFMNKAKKLLS